MVQNFKKNRAKVLLIIVGILLDDILFQAIDQGSTVGRFMDLYQTSM